MNPSDVRALGWERMQASLTALRQRCYRAWQTYGPGTTEEVALTAGISLLTFRPRATELVQLGLVELLKIDGGEGVYQAVARDTWERREADRRRGRPAEQLSLL